MVCLTCVEHENGRGQGGVVDEALEHKREQLLLVAQRLGHHGGVQVKEQHAGPGRRGSRRGVSRGGPGSARWHPRSGEEREHAG